MMKTKMQEDKDLHNIAFDWPDTEPVAQIHIDQIKRVCLALIAMLYRFIYKVYYLALNPVNTTKEIKPFLLLSDWAAMKITIWRHFHHYQSKQEMVPMYRLAKSQRFL